MTSWKHRVEDYLTSMGWGHLYMLVPTDTRRKQQPLELEVSVSHLM